MSPPLTARSVTRRFLALTALRWLPVGLVIPVIMLLPLERGLSLAEVGLAASLQGLVVLALELPTGGLADTVGRRRVLLVASAVGLAATTLLLTAGTAAAFAVAFALQGAFRALDSGPLDAWYVDAVLEADPGAAIEKGLSGHGVVAGVAIAGGSLTSGALVGLAPAWGRDALWGLDALAVPVLVSLLLQVAGLVGIVTLLREEPRARGVRAVWRAAATTPRAIAGGASLLRRDRILLALVAVELFWGFGMVTFEQLMPVRLTELVGDPDSAAAITGPATAAAWLVSAAGAAAMPWLGRRLGTSAAAAALRVAQGAAVVGMGLLGGVAAMLAAYVACYLVHGASGAAHATLLHRRVTGEHRATVVSLNSMVMQPAGAAGMVVLTALADGTSVSVAVCVGGAVLALAAPLYLPAWRQERAARRGGATGAEALAADGRAHVPGPDGDAEVRSARG
ncbi:MFS transporter [Georgenia soli]|uniref:MFS transporter n=1 Tax=Georgenia soli TaxID=638953 RepID=A0A2A9EIV9_9MICO|nr:MFS transporter [Georgenia soli]PFG38451.1 MFS transporter [Georgenia soli]